MSPRLTFPIAARVFATFVMSSLAAGSASAGPRPASLLGWQTTGEGAPQRPAQGDEVPRLSVIVCDSARGPAETLTASERAASRVFLKVGIEIQWLDCSPIHVADVKDVEQGIACHRPRVPGQMVLEVLPRAVPGKTGPREVAGFARLPRDGQPGDCVGVFYDRARDLAPLGDASTAQILGHFAAHEIGHILLGAQSHSRGGIMRPDWSRQDMTRAAWGLLTFEPRQAEGLRAGALARDLSRSGKSARATPFDLYAER